MKKRNPILTALGAAVLAVLLLATPAIAQTFLIDEDWESPGGGAGNNFQLDNTTTAFPGWNWVGSGNDWKLRTNAGDGVPVDGNVIKMEWYDGGNAAEYDTSHTWSAGDQFGLSLNATEQNWNGSNDRNLTVSIVETVRDGGGNLTGTTVWTQTAALVLDSNHDNPPEGYGANGTFSWIFDTDDFTGGTAGSGITLVLGGSGSRGHHIDNIQLVLNPPEDNSAPTPNPITFLNPDGFPAALSGSSITMTATGALDPSGVEYYFAETSGNPGGDDSPWQVSPSYTDTGLEPNTQYTYTVTARDRSPNQNVGSTSAPASVTTDPPDMVAPTPNPMTFLDPDGLPVGISASSITMTATTAEDPSDVEYYFAETSGNPGGDDSPWQDEPTYTDTGLNAGTQYTYTVTARDKSTAQNVGTPSAPASATTKPPGILVDEDWQSPNLANNTRLDDLSLYPGWKFIQGNGNIFKSQDAENGDGRPGPAGNQLLQLEWDGQNAEYDTSHSWSASDQFTLTLNATEQNWGSENDRTVVVEISETIRDGSGNLTSTPLWSQSALLPQVDPDHDSVGEPWSEAQIFNWTIDAGTDFIGGTPGSPITFEVGSTGSRGLYVDNILLALSGPPTDFVITEIIYNPDAVPDPTVTLTWNKTRADSYIAKISADMMDWGTDIGDSLTAAGDLRPEDPDHITMELALPPDPKFGVRAHFRIEEE